MTSQDGWLIGKLSDRVGVSAHTIRYYERLELLKPPKRTESQYRIYGKQDEERLRFIHKAKKFGLSLDEIKQLIAISTKGMPPCASLKTMVKQHLDDLDRQIAEMISLRQELASRYKKIDKSLPDASTPATEEICQGKICGLIESIE
ncbi:heavy metal-responsive transcriptional regulator [Pleurocapsa sp. CCALA 161]|uniref:heavy metal-responsive transcriptional regulator n=1 Tax=Pleurocapsa sp. CCALA 161 TaxID=2107688 RepID=UPI000D069D85|nr:heavy metal-responsive transcriptional regulator [Pleurocapsa sp. CCALA 161]PSB06862.1 heavy metal-responsive transcriptional regulator [Pleurocapsa sp. CCALA 161]